MRAGYPVELLAFDHLPPADEFVHAVGQERQAKHLANHRAERTRRERLAQLAVAAVLVETE